MAKRKTIWWALALLALVWPALAWADAGDAGMDAASVGDAATPGVDLGVFEVGTEDAQAATVRFSGTVTLQAAEEQAGARLSLEHQDDATLSEATTTDDAGRFEFSSLEPGAYDLTITRPGYETLQTEITLERDTSRNFRLFVDAAVEVVVAVTFSGDAREVELVLESERERIEETLSPDGDVATFEGELGVAHWTVSAGAEGYETVQYELELSPGQGAQRVNLRLSPAQQPEVFVDGCGCGTTGSPLAALIPLLLVFAWLAVSRGRRCA